MLSLQYRGMGKGLSALACMLEYTYIDTFIYNKYIKNMDARKDK